VPPIKTFSSSQLIFESPSRSIFSKFSMSAGKRRITASRCSTSDLAVITSSWPRTLSKRL